LKPDVNVTMEFQFQLDRRLFCQMHYALDKLHSTDLVLPDLDMLIKQKPVNQFDVSSMYVALSVSIACCDCEILG
jgi:hypothetical protein